MANMLASTVFSAGGLLTIFLVLGIAVNTSQSQSFEEEGEDSLEALGDDVIFQAENEDGTPSNRVLPVDAEHGNKISFPTSPLEASCVKMLKYNLLTFLKRVKRSEGKRKGKQDDGDDGDGDGEEGIQGVINNLAEGNGALSVLSAVPAALPQLVNTLTQFSSAINQGLNGTDTPDIPSFLAKQGMDAVKFFQAITGGGNHAAHASAQVPGPIHVQKIPGTDPVPRPRPPASGATNYEYPTDPDYPEEEDVKQPPQPALKPLKPGETASGKYPGVEPIPGSNSKNPFFQGDLQPGGIRRPNAKPTADPNAQYLDGLPSKTSLWSIYKSFRNNGLANGSLTNFQLAHPDAFSNELLQSISQSISSNRGQASGSLQQGPTDRPASEVLQQLFPTGKPSPFASLNKPTLSVYRPSVSNSGIGIDLSNIALNQTSNIIDENEQSNAANNEYESEEATISPSNQEQQELEANDVEGVRKRVPGGSGSTSNFGYTHLQQSNNNNQGGQQHSQQFESQSNGNAQFVKSPTSSHLTITMGSYVPAISSLHEGDEELNKVGPQTNFGDNANGFRNKAPYNKVKGVLIEAPRLTPSPYLNLKRPAGLTGNFGGFNNNQNPTTTPTPPNLSYQFSHQQKPASLYPPGASSYRPSDPNAPRAPALIASIPSSFQLSQNPLKNSGIVPSSLIPNSGNPTPETEAFKVAITDETSYIPAKVVPEVVEEDLGAPENDNEGVSSNNNAPPSNVSPTPQYNSSVSLLSLYQKLGNQPIQSQLLANTLLNGNNNLKESPTVTSLVQPEEITTKASILSLVSPSNSGLKFSSSLTANQAPQNSPLVQSLLGNLKEPQTQPTVNSEPHVKPQLENGKDDGSSNSKEPETLSSLSVSTSTPVSTETQEDIVSSISSTLIPARVQPEENDLPLLQPIQSQLASFFPITPQVFPAQIKHNELPHLVYFPTAATTTTTTTPEPTTVRASPVLNQYGAAGAPIKNNLLVTGNYNFQQNSQPQGFPSPINSPISNQNHFFNGLTQNPGIPPKNQTVKPKPKTTTTTSRPSSSNIIGGTFSFANLAPSPLFPTHIQNAINANVKPASTGSASAGPFQPYQPSAGNNQQPQLTGQPYLPNIAAKPPNSNNAQQVPYQSTTFPPFATAIGYIPNNNNHLQAPPRQTTTKKPTTTTTPKPQPKPVHQNYQFITAGLPVSSIYSPQAPSGNEFKPLIVSNQGFQNLSPVQNAGYPAYVPSTPVRGSSSGSSSPSGFQNPKPNYGSNGGSPQKPNYGRPGVISDVLAQAQQNLIPNTPHVLDNPQSPQTGSFNQSFSETLATKNVSMSAIVEMAKLPFYQEDSFRPSAIPPHILVSGNEDYSLEKVDGETNTKSPTISELFSSITKASQNQNQKIQEKVSASTTTTSAPLTTIIETTANSISSVTVEDDYSDQEIPPPGKPIYWMNMYYPNGVPVLTKVRTTTVPTTINPRRRRRRTTPFATTEGAEADSDEYDEGSSTTKRKKAQT